MNRRPGAPEATNPGDSGETHPTRARAERETAVPLADMPDLLAAHRAVGAFNFITLEVAEAVVAGPRPPRPA